MDGLATAFKLWAKTDGKSERWHAVPCHLIDVGACAEKLWNSLSQGSQKVAVEFFGSFESARCWLAFLAAVHDIGKINRFFQAKNEIQRARLSGLGVEKSSEPMPHGVATDALLSKWLVDRAGWNRKHANNVGIAVGGHHGIFMPQNGAATILELDRGYVHPVEQDIFNKFADLFRIQQFQPFKGNLNGFLVWLAGFVTVSDWLGSHDVMTTWCETEVDLEKYKIEADAKAEKLFHLIGWKRPTAGNCLNLDQLLPQGASPNSLQFAAESIVNRGFGFVLIEAPTGGGKTEAAFRLAEAGRSAGSGVYFALPTMATANGIYDRFNDYLKSATGEDDFDASLLHSQAWLRKYQADSDSELDFSLSHQESDDWFRGSKRGLLAPYGVGTIDQCLFGALKAKHFFVRLFALAGKTVIIDEVHAYDAYMSDLLATLLGYLKCLNCRVILLSATLPNSRRKALFQAWGAEVPESVAEYPRLTWANYKGDAVETPFQTQMAKPLSFELCELRNTKVWVSGAEKILKLVTEHGGVGALIVNTVKEAQHAYEFLQQRTDKDCPVYLFHSRFTVEDRAKKERYVLENFGKRRPGGRKGILVATQVVEQSLDLDFDHMVSSLAPIDLLIQRAGRLHRHARNAEGELQPNGHPDERPLPTLYVMEPLTDEEGGLQIEERIYAKNVLHRTHFYLSKHTVIEEPRQISRAVNWIYDGEVPTEFDRDWAELIERIGPELDSKDEHQHFAAEDATLCGAETSFVVTHQVNISEEAEDDPGSHLAAKTRLEDTPSATLVIQGPSDEWDVDYYDIQRKIGLALRTVRTPVYPDLLRDLISMKKPMNWQRSGPSRNAFPIKVDGTGKLQSEAFTYHYQSEIGLTITKNHADL